MKLDRNLLWWGVAAAAIPLIIGSFFDPSELDYQAKKLARDDDGLAAWLIAGAIISLSFLGNPLGRDHVRKYVPGSYATTVVIAVLCLAGSFCLVYFGSAQIGATLGFR